MVYNPRPVPEVGDVGELRMWLNEELKILAQSLVETTELELRNSRHAPERPREGMIIHTDGTTWDPGAGRGTYRYENGAWVKISKPSDFDFNVTTVGDANYTILSTDHVVVTNTAFTAARTWTLPAASSVKPNQPIYVWDRLGTITSTNTLTVQRAGTDTLAGGITSFVLSTPTTGLLLISDGVSKWAYAFLSVGANTILDRFGPTAGQILIRDTSVWGLAGGSGAIALTKGFNLTAFDLGTVSSGSITPEPYNGAHQKVTGNGAFTWNAPTTAGESRIILTNGSTAGAVTFSGFTKKLGSGVLTTTNAHKFIITIGKIDGDEFYAIDPLQ